MSEGELDGLEAGVSVNLSRRDKSVLSSQVTGLKMERMGLL